MSSVSHLKTNKQKKKNQSEDQYDTTKTQQCASFLALQVHRFFHFVLYRREVIHLQKIESLKSQHLGIYCTVNFIG